jgi:hypothetical protein
VRRQVILDPSQHVAECRGRYFLGEFVQAIERHPLVDERFSEEIAFFDFVIVQPSDNLFFLFAAFQRWQPFRRTLLDDLPDFVGGVQFLRFQAVPDDANG